MSFWPVTAHAEADRQLLVSDLIVSGDRSWDAEKLNRVLWPIRSSVPLG